MKNRTIKTRPAKTFDVTDGVMVGIDHFVYDDGKRVGRVMETRANGKTLFEAERGKEILMNGPTIRRFKSLDAACRAI